MRVGTVGRVLPGFEAKIIDPETGQDLGDNVQGEFCSAPRSNDRLLQHAGQNRGAIDADGWLRSGDLALRMPNGYYRITGRLKDMVIRGGENVYPREIEERLHAHPAIEDVQVVGVPDRKYGEEILAWVKLRKGQRRRRTNCAVSANKPHALQSAAVLEIRRKLSPR
ncbi:MAG: AMP-binding protein [Planctomycetaceae bacterium]